MKVDTTCVFQLPLLNIQFPNESWDLSEELVDRLEGLAVTLLGELEIVPHVVVRDALVNLGDKSGVDDNDKKLTPEQ